MVLVSCIPVLVRSRELRVHALNAHIHTVQVPGAQSTRTEAPPPHPIEARTRTCAKESLRTRARCATGMSKKSHGKRSPAQPPVEELVKMNKINKFGRNAFTAYSETHLLSGIVRGGFRSQECSCIQIPYNYVNVARTDAGVCAITGPKFAQCFALRVRGLRARYRTGNHHQEYASCTYVQ